MRSFVYFDSVGSKLPVFKNAVQICVGVDTRVLRDGLCWWKRGCGGVYGSTGGKGIQAGGTVFKNKKNCE